MEIQPQSKAKSKVWPSQPNQRVSTQQTHGMMLGGEENTLEHKEGESDNSL